MKKPIFDPIVETLEPVRRLGFEMDGYIYLIAIEKQNIGRRHQSHMILKLLNPVDIPQQNRAEGIVIAHLCKCDGIVGHGNAIQRPAKSHKLIEVQIG